MIPDTCKKRKARAVTHEALIDSQFFRSCVSCDEFTTEEVCSMYNARPPARVIVLGCDAWHQDIPF